jgi:hypothetical protein
MYKRVTGAGREAREREDTEVTDLKTEQRSHRSERIQLRPLGFDAAPAGTAGWREGGISRTTQAPEISVLV